MAPMIYASFARAYTNNVKLVFLGKGLVKAGSHVKAQRQTHLNHIDFYHGAKVEIPYRTLQSMRTSIAVI